MLQFYHYIFPLLVVNKPESSPKPLVVGHLCVPIRAIGRGQLPYTTLHAAGDGNAHPVNGREAFSNGRRHLRTHKCFGVWPREFVYICCICMCTVYAATCMHVATMNVAIKFSVGIRFLHQTCRLLLSFPIY